MHRSSLQNLGTCCTVVLSLLQRACGKQLILKLDILFETIFNATASHNVVLPNI
jgi:hypothetical protein